jgi:hypothetical protein
MTDDPAAQTDGDATTEGGACELLTKAVFTIEYTAKVNNINPFSLTFNATLNGHDVTDSWPCTTTELYVEYVELDTAEARTEWENATREYEKLISERMLQLLPEQLKAAITSSYYLSFGEVFNKALHAIDPNHDYPDLFRQRFANVVGKEARSLVRKQLQLPPQGRPPKHTKVKLEQMIRRAVAGFRKKNYGRSPALPEVASELQMPVATLKSLLHRQGLRYSTYKRDA